MDELLACLLRQLIQGSADVPASVQSLYNNHLLKGTRPSASELSGALHEVIGWHSQVFIVIDALDEWQILGGSRTRIVDEIFNFQADYNINLMVTSRDIPEIVARFKDKPVQRITATKPDVMKYLNGRLDKLPNFVARNAQLQEEIITRITDTADGM